MFVTYEGRDSRTHVRIPAELAGKTPRMSFREYCEKLRRSIEPHSDQIKFTLHLKEEEFSAAIREFETLQLISTFCPSTALQMREMTVCGMKLKWDIPYYG